MSFWKNLHPLLRADRDDYGSANSAILNAIDSSLSDAERAEVATKVQRSLETATGEYLDYWGRWFNTARRDGETDDAYRERIKYYLLMSRGTIQGIIDGLKYWLQDNALYAEVYEPWHNIFTLNRSKLNGEDSIAGSYYRYAVIDVKLDRPISKEILDIIYAYKPAGVLLYTTYAPNLNIKADAITLAMLNANVKIQAFANYGGIGDYGGNIIGFGDLDEAAMQSMNHTLFTTNDSKTNGEDYISGNIFNDYNPYAKLPVNMLKGTSDQPQTATGGDYLISTVGTFNPNKGMQYTVSVDIKQMDHSMLFQVWTMSESKRVKLIITNVLKTAGRSSITFTAPTSDDYDSIAAQLAWTNDSDAGSYAWSQAKAEIGTTASPWSPNPADPEYYSKGAYYVGLAGAHRNLLIGSGRSVTVPAQTWGDNQNLILDTSSLKIGDVVSFQVEVDGAKTAKLFMALNARQVSSIFSNGAETSTITWTEGLSKLSLPVRFSVKTMGLTDEYTWSKAKAEIGTTASPWSPAPEDNVANLPDTSPTWVQDGIRQATKLEDNVKSGNIFNNDNNNIFGEIRIQEFLLSKYSAEDSENILATSTLSPYIEVSGVLRGNANIVISQVSYPILNGRTLIPIKTSDIIKDSTGISKIPFCLIGEEGTTLDLDKIVFGYKFLREKEAGVAVSAGHMIKSVSIPPIVGTAVVGKTKL